MSLDWAIKGRHCGYLSVKDGSTSLDVCVDPEGLSVEMEGEQWSPCRGYWDVTLYGVIPWEALRELLSRHGYELVHKEKVNDY